MHDHPRPQGFGGLVRKVIEDMVAERTRQACAKAVWIDAAYC